MTMREGAVHDDRLFGDRARLPAFEKGAKPFDEFGRAVGEIEQCAFFDLTVLAIGFAQEDGGRRVPVGDGFDIHGRMIAPYQRSYNHKITNYMATFLRLISEIPIEPQRLKRFRGWKFRLDGARRRRRFGHCSRQCPCPCRWSPSTGRPDRSGKPACRALPRPDFPSPSGIASAAAGLRSSP